MFGQIFIEVLCINLVPPVVKLISGDLNTTFAGVNQLKKGNTGDFQPQNCNLIGK